MVIEMLCVYLCYMYMHVACMCTTLQDFLTGLLRHKS